MTKDQRRSLTKKALLDALVICLKDQDFNEITTIRLVQTAGISRSSFYTHYKDKFEMIDSYQKELFHKLEYIFDKYEGKKEGAFLEIFEILTREKLLSALLSTNGAKEIQDFLINKLQRMIAKDFIDPTAEKRALKGLAWAEQPQTINEVGSTFTIQGFDLNYAGVILGPSVKYRN